MSGHLAWRAIYKGMNEYWSCPGAAYGVEEREERDGEVDSMPLTCPCSSSLFLSLSLSLCIHLSPIYFYSPLSF